MKEGIFVNNKFWVTALWMFVSVAIIYIVLEWLVLGPAVEWIKAYFGW